MKLEVSDLGRIRHAEIELRPLTVFVGTDRSEMSLGLGAVAERLGQGERFFPIPFERLMWPWFMDIRPLPWRMTENKSCWDLWERALSPHESVSGEFPELLGHLWTIVGGRVRWKHLPGPLFLELEDTKTEQCSPLAYSLWMLQGYLEHIAHRDDWLLIEEPEMGAHPRSQLAIAELLALMVSSGIRVLVTTHSPYLVDHLSNLMAASRLPAALQREAAGWFELGTSEAFVDPEQVSAWQFDDAGDEVIVSDILDRELPAIDISTFSEQSDRLGVLYGKIRDAGRLGRTG